MWNVSRPIVNPSWLPKLFALNAFDATLASKQPDDDDDGDYNGDGNDDGDDDDDDDDGDDVDANRRASNPESK